MPGDGRGLDRQHEAGRWRRAIQGVVHRPGYQKHRHDTYAIGVTDSGVQVFDYRGSVRASTPGQVVVLYPDEVHDGRAGTNEGFGDRIVYVAPSLLAEAVRVLCRRPYPLPFVSEPVSTNTRLSQAIEGAFRAPLGSLAVDTLIVDGGVPSYVEKGDGASFRLVKYTTSRRPWQGGHRRNAPWRRVSASRLERMRLRRSH